MVAWWLLSCICYGFAGFFFFFFNFGFWFWWDLGGQRWRGGHGGGVVIVTRLFGFFWWVCWVFCGYLLSFFLFFY